MSWAEVKRINSDFMNEPLNFHNYISDISTFGAESYVLDSQNEWVFRELMSYSLLVYGHKGIHETIYERLTDQDVDYVLQKNGRLGQAFNSFYRCKYFESGGIDSVIRNLTERAYAKLDIKFQKGIHRYAESKLSASQGVGTWLDSLFELNYVQLQLKETLQEIVTDEAVMNELMKHESIVLLLCCSASLMSIDMSDELFGRLIVSIANSTQATLDLIETTAMEDRLWELFGNQEVMSVLVNNRMSMDAIVQNSKAFSVLLNTSGAMTTLSNSSVGREVLATALSQALTANEVCDTAREATMVLMGTHNKLIQGSAVTDLLNETHEQITKTVDTMLSLLSKTDVIFANVSNLLDHTDAMKQMMNSRELMKLILSKTATKVAFLKAVEDNATLKPIFRESLETSGFYTKSKLTTKTYTPVQVEETENYAVEGTVNAKAYAITNLTRLYVYDKTTTDNGGSGPYKLSCDGVSKKTGTIKANKTSTTEVALDYLCHSYTYSSTVTGTVPTDCMQKLEYYTYTIS